MNINTELGKSLANLINFVYLSWYWKSWSKILTIRSFFLTGHWSLIQAAFIRKLSEQHKCISNGQMSYRASIDFYLQFQEIEQKCSSVVHNVTEWDESVRLNRVTWTFRDAYGCNSLRKAQYDGFVNASTKIMTDRFELTPGIKW